MIQHLMIGVLKSIYATKVFANKETGEVITPAKDKAQIELKEHDPVANTYRYTIQTLTVANPQEWLKFVGKEVYIYCKQYVIHEDRKVIYAPIYNSVPVLYQQTEKTSDVNQSNKKETATA